MDPNINSPEVKNNWKGLINRKNILILLGVIILVEVLWAGWTIFQTNKQINQTAPVVAQAQPSKIELQSNKQAVKVGEQVTVSVNVVSDKATDGIDLIINYDPTLLSVVETPEDTPVILGTLYNEYPLNILDVSEGKITVSGIATSIEGTKPNGIFGSIVFKAEKAGSTQISLQFEKGSTADTNIIEKGTGEDILESVENVTISINP